MGQGQGQGQGGAGEGEGEREGCEGGGGSPAHFLLVSFSMDLCALVVQVEQWVVLRVWLRKS